MKSSLSLENKKDEMSLLNKSATIKEFLNIYKNFDKKREIV